MRAKGKDKKHISSPEISIPGKKRESPKNRALFAPNEKGKSRTQLMVVSLHILYTAL